MYKISQASQTACEHERPISLEPQARKSILVKLIESDAEPMKAASGRGVEACQDAALGMQGTASAMNADLSRICMLSILPRIRRKLLGRSLLSD